MGCFPIVSFKTYGTAARNRQNRAVQGLFASRAHVCPSSAKQALHIIERKINARMVDLPYR